MPELFTIGHSNHDFAGFLSLLKEHGIDAVADVRSHPFSCLPWFNQPSLELELEGNGIRYVFLGAELGARRTERECYIGPRADYELISKTEAFRRGIERLETGVSKFRIALMCAEKDPLDCHRTVLVCRHAKRFAEISHIHADGRLESHDEAEGQMLRRYTPDEDDLFRSRIELLNQAYKRRGEEIAYAENDAAS